MKKLGIQAFFALPDDFNGTAPQALRLLADHLENNTDILAQKGEDITAEETAGWLATYSRWWDSFNRGHRFAGLIGLRELRDNQWVRIDHGIKVKE